MNTSDSKITFYIVTELARSLSKCKPTWHEVFARSLSTCKPTWHEVFARSLSTCKPTWHEVIDVYKIPITLIYTVKQITTILCEVLCKILPNGGANSGIHLDQLFFTSVL